MASSRAMSGAQKWIAWCIRIHVTGDLETALGTPDLSGRTLEDAVTDAIRDAIVNGRFLPGAELRQGPLAMQLGVSRIPLRDALHRLESEGLVLIDGRRGARVSVLTAEEIANIYDVRILLESEAARRTIERIDDATTATLVRLSEEMDAASKDPERGLRAKNAFYLELYRHCGNPRLVAVVERLRDDVSRYHLLAGSSSAHAHGSLRTLLIRRDAQGFAEALRTHLEAVRDDLIARLEADPVTVADGR